MLLTPSRQRRYAVAGVCCAEGPGEVFRERLNQFLPRPPSLPPSPSLPEPALLNLQNQPILHVLYHG